MDILRFTTAGSVDDGKSTLIGRLLYDSKSILQDQYEAIERSSQLMGDGSVNLALLTDGLRAEREQGITIDVAYRYFSTSKRKFIIADTPGHEQYTRNMVTGASTAELAIVLIDARNGVLTQSKRHGFIASLLEIPHVLVAVNKMDLVDYDQHVFDQIVDEYSEFARRLEVEDIVYIPISARDGDNVVHKSENMPWYEGATLLHHLETVKTGASENSIDFRFPVQYVVRPHQDFRGFAGQIASGTIRPGHEVMALPSGTSSKVESVVTFENELDEARPGDSVVITLQDEIDVSRGDMLVRTRNRPTISSQVDADLCWMHDTPLTAGKRYLMRHLEHEVQVFVDKIVYRTNINTLHREKADSFQLNDLGRVEITTAEPIFFDPYRINRKTGSFILIDPDTFNTVGAGMIRGEAKDVSPVGERSSPYVRPKTRDTVWENVNIPRIKRESLNGHKAAVLWFTGFSGSGKSTIGKEVEKGLFDLGCRTMLLDGDQLRHGLNGDLAFSPRDREENIRRVAEVARLFYEQGNIVVCTFVSPYQADRDFARSLVDEGRFFEIHVNTPIDVCRQRDPKGLYAKAAKGEITNLTGISAPYEVPENAECSLDTVQNDLESNVQLILSLIKENGIIT